MLRSYDFGTCQGGARHAEHNSYRVDGCDYGYVKFVGSLRLQIRLQFRPMSSNPDLRFTARHRAAATACHPSYRCAQHSADPASGYSASRDHFVSASPDLQ